MTLRLTPDMLAAGYDFLRTTEPFNGWKLPESDELGFHVIRDKSAFAHFIVENGTPVIQVSEITNGHTATLLGTLAHEILHLRQHLTGNRLVHGARFKQMAARVCKAHGMDPKTF